MEDFNGNFVAGNFILTVFFVYDVNKKEWKNFIFHKNDSTSLPYDKVISICEDSRKRLWFMTQGAGFAVLIRKMKALLVLICRKVS